MQVSHLRIYYGPGSGPDGEPASIETTPTTEQTKRVTVPLSEILPLLGEAVRSERTWLDDFANDEITIPGDLYEVVLAYRHFRCPSA